MESLNIDNRSKVLAFKKFKRLLNISYPKFVKMSKKHLNKFDIGQFLDFFYIKSYYSIGRVLKNVNVLQVATDKNPATSIY